MTSLRFSILSANMTSLIISLAYTVMWHVWHKTIWKGFHGTRRLHIFCTVYRL